MSPSPTRVRSAEQEIRRTIEEAEQHRKAALRTTRQAGKAFDLERQAGRAGLRKRFGLRLIFGICLAALVLILVPPFHVPAEGRVTSPFFYRFAPDRRLPVPEFHDAIDIGVPVGTTVHSTAPGRVAETGYNDTAGHYVLVRHPLGFSSYYAHLSRIDVKINSLVFPLGPGLGDSGNTGRSTGPHLHFAVYLGSLPLPPESLILFHRLRLALLRF